VVVVVVVVVVVLIRWAACCMLRTAWLLTSLVSLVVQFVADGMFYAELNAYLTSELAEDGYSGVEVRVTPTKTEIIVKATKYVRAVLHVVHRNAVVSSLYKRTVLLCTTSRLDRSFFSTVSRSNV
jgi:hypothetical protein